MKEIKEILNDKELKEHNAFFAGIFSGRIKRSNGQIDMATIRNYFKNISNEDFEKNLKKAEIEIENPEIEIENILIGLFIVGFVILMMLVAQ